MAALYTGETQICVKTMRVWHLIVGGSSGQKCYRDVRCGSERSDVNLSSNEFNGNVKEIEHCH